MRFPASRDRAGACSRPTRGARAGRATRLARVPLALKPAYLIHGDDHVRIAARRARLRAFAEQQSGAGGVEVLEGEQATPADAARALNAMTFALGRRVIIVDGAERWKEKDVAEHLLGALGDLMPDTTIAFFAREAGRAQAPACLHQAVISCGGAVDAEVAVKAWDLPKWAVAYARAHDLGIDLEGARTLVALTGPRQAQLAREIEKLALEAGPGASLDADEVAARAAGSAERQIWTLADALVAREGGGAARAYLRLRVQGERLESMLYWMTRRVREALAVAVALESGKAAADIKRGLRMPPKAAERFIADVRRSDSAHLRGSLGTLADLELASRGGSELASDTLALRAIEAMAGPG